MLQTSRTGRYAVLQILPPDAPYMLRLHNNSLVTRKVHMSARNEAEWLTALRRREYVAASRCTRRALVIDDEVK